jgi:hypothetical protein
MHWDVTSFREYWSGASPVSESTNTESENDSVVMRKIRPDLQNLLYEDTGHWWVYKRNNCLVWWGYELINPLEHVVIGISAEGVYASIITCSNGFIKLITPPQTTFSQYLILTGAIFGRFPFPMPHCFDGCLRHTNLRWINKNNT